MGTDERLSRRQIAEATTTITDMVQQFKDQSTMLVEGIAGVEHQVVALRSKTEEGLSQASRRIDDLEEVLLYSTFRERLRWLFTGRIG